MNRVMHLGLALVLVLAIGGLAGHRAGASVLHTQSDFDTSLRRFPGALSWHWKLFHLMPRNFTLFRAAVEEQRELLKPGEHKRFLIVMSVGADRKPRDFKALIGIDDDWLLRTDEMIARDVIIEIHQPSRVRMSAVPTLSQNGWDAIRSGAPAGSTLAAMDLADANFAIAAENARLGLDPSSGETMVDLLSKDARALADGRVILIARAGQDVYDVFNTSTRKTESAKPGAELKQSGNTLFLLCEQGGRRFVVAYRGLASIDASLEAGSEVKARQRLGSISDGNPQRSDASIHAWRITRDDQLFLRNLETGAVCVYGW